MEKVVGADKGAEVPVIEPNKSGEVSAAKKEDFYTKSPASSLRGSVRLF